MAAKGQRTIATYLSPCNKISYRTIHQNIRGADQDFGLIWFKWSSYNIPQIIHSSHFLNLDLSVSHANIGSTWKCHPVAPIVAVISLRWVCFVWNSLPDSIVNSLTLESFKFALDHHRRTWNMWTLTLNLHTNRITIRHLFHYVYTSYFHPMVFVKQCFFDH